MDIEEKAVAAVKNYIADFSTLTSFIVSKDKVPLTDGHIDMHSGVPQTKRNLVGRINVQVKGKWQLEDREQTSIRLRTADLEGYQALNGVLLFVVFVTSTTSTIRYVNLHPTKLDKLLSSASDSKKSIRVETNSLPETHGDFERVLKVALAANVAPELGIDPFIFQNLNRLTVTSAKELQFDRPFEIDTTEAEAIVEIKTAGGMTVRLHGVLAVEPLFVSREVRLASGTTCFDRAKVRPLGGRKLEISVNSALKLEIDPSAANDQLSVCLSSTSSVGDRLTALEFAAALVGSGNLIVDDVSIDFVSSQKPIEGFEVEIEFLTSLVVSSRKLHFDIDLIDLLKIDNYEVVSTVCEAISNGSLVEGLEGVPGRWIVDIAGWKMLFLAAPSRDGDGAQLIDPFDPDFQMELQMENLQDPNHELIPVTPYEFFEAEDLTQILNLNLETIVSRYQKLSNPKVGSGLAVTKVLHLLSAADLSPQRRSEFLEAALALTSWVFETSGDDPLMMINRWQIDARRFGLSPDQLLQIRSLKNQLRVVAADPDAAQIILAYSILLNEPEEIDYWYAELSEKDRENFESWPIANLRNPEFWAN